MLGCILVAIMIVCNPEEEGINFFIKYQHSSGCVRDRASNNQVFSCAASGFAMDVYAIAAEKKYISHKEATERIGRAINFYVDTTPATNRGWLYHFHDCRGHPLFNKEISTIDTAIFYQGARQAARRIKDKDLEKRIINLIAAIDQEWMIKNSPSGQLFSHGISGGQFIPHEWDDYNEGILIYSLFGRPFKPKKIDYSLPLFVYYYPLCFIQDSVLEKHLKKAIEYQKSNFGYYGITSSDTMRGYEFYPVGYYSPLAVYSVQPFYKETIVTEPLVGSIHLTTGWKSTDEIAIDVGAAILLRNR